MEERRLAATRDLELFDTEPEFEFDELVRLAAKVCETPMSTIALLDEHRVWCKARYGVSTAESPRAIAFCDHAIRGSDLLVVEDARKDPLFRNYPLVTQPRELRFYAGMPITGRGGHKIGTLCVLDQIPRDLSADQRSSLRILGHQVGAHMELRLQRRDLRLALEERATLLADLSAKEQLFQTFMQYSPMSSFIKDGEGRYVYYNRKMAESAGVTSDSAIGLTDADIWPVETARRLRENDRRALDAETVLEIDEVTTANGETTAWRCFKFPWRTAAGEQMLAGIALDVTAERRHQAELHHYQAKLEDMNVKLKHSANTDPLTGLGNRRALDEGIQAAEGTPVVAGEEIAVLTIDIDHFKQVNDTLGHAYGDSALQQIASAIARSTRAQDLVARSGGEEFTILLPVGGASTAMMIGHRILKEVRSIHWQHHSISVSIGISIAAVHDATLTSVIARSDQALYAAKQQGRDGLFYLCHEEDDYQAAAQQETVRGRSGKAATSLRDSAPCCSLAVHRVKKVAEDKGLQPQ